MIRALGAMALLLPSVAWACSCIFSESPPLFGNADVVFHGKVIALPRDGAAHYTVEVLEHFLGPTRQHIFVVTGSGGGDCGMPLELGEEYLLYGYRTQGLLADTYEISICSQSTGIWNVSDEKRWNLRARRDAQRSSSTGLRLRL